MKVIISHDVDHLYSMDHYKDLYFPKLWFRTTIDLLKGDTTFKEWYLRCSLAFKKEISFIVNLIEFDTDNKIPSAFFFGMANGKGLSYKQKAIAPIMQYVQSRGFEIGVHGIDNTTFEGIQKESMDFSNNTGLKSYGIRIHYVKLYNNTLDLLARNGYVYDSTEFNKNTGYTIKAPYQVGNMWEFPICLMDSYLPKNLCDAKKFTIEIIEKAEKVNIPYLTILFHDVYFCDAYKTYQEWYKWIVEYLSKNGYLFISYKDATEELRKEN